MAQTPAPRKTPSYLLDENWSKLIPNPAEPECTVSTYRRYANEYQTEPIEGTIAITVNDYAQYSLEWWVDMDWSANRAASTVVRWDGDQKTLDAVRKLVAAGVRKAVTDADRTAFAAFNAVGHGAALGHIFVGKIRELIVEDEPIHHQARAELCFHRCRHGNGVAVAVDNREVAGGR